MNLDAASLGARRLLHTQLVSRPTGHARLACDLPRAMRSGRSTTLGRITVRVRLSQGSHDRGALCAQKLMVCNGRGWTHPSGDPEGYETHHDR